MAVKVVARFPFAFAPNTPVDSDLLLAGKGEEKELLLLILLLSPFWWSTRLGGV